MVNAFWTHGYAGADVDTLQRSAGIQRGSFYAAFGDKPTAFLEALQRYLDETLYPKLPMLAAGAPEAEALPGFLRAVGDFVARQGSRGCMLSEALTDASIQDPNLQRALSRIRGQLFRKLRKLGHGDEALASFVLASALGFHGLARSGASRKQIRAAAAMAAEAVSDRMHWTI